MESTPTTTTVSGICPACGEPEMTFYVLDPADPAVQSGFGGIHYDDPVAVAPVQCHGCRAIVELEDTQVCGYCRTSGHTTPECPQTPTDEVDPDDEAVEDYPPVSEAWHAEAGRTIESVMATLNDIVGPVRCGTDDPQVTADRLTLAAASLLGIVAAQMITEPEVELDVERDRVADRILDAR